MSLLYDILTYLSNFFKYLQIFYIAFHFPYLIRISHRFLLRDIEALLKILNLILHWIFDKNYDTFVIVPIVNENMILKYIIFIYPKKKILFFIKLVQMKNK